jgi:hypothetical protein
MTKNLKNQLYLNIILEDNKLIKRRVNRVIQENAGLISKVNALESENMMMITAPTIQPPPQIAAKSPSSSDMRIIQEISIKVDKFIAEIDEKLENALIEIEDNKEIVRKLGIKTFNRLLNTKGTFKSVMSFDLCSQFDLIS